MRYSSGLKQFFSAKTVPNIHWAFCKKYPLLDTKQSLCNFAHCFKKGFLKPFFLSLKPDIHPTNYQVWQIFLKD